MKKILTLLAISSFTSIFSQVSVNANIPTTVSSGSSVDAEVKIVKGAIGNFAKYQMDVPVGYVVTATDPKGGNFTFENQRAKIVWVSVPAEAEFVVKLKLQVGSNAVSPGTFTQKFYFLENSEKKEVEATPITVTIGDGGAAVAVSNTQPVTETKPVEPVKTTQPEETKPVTETKPVEVKPTETKVVETKPVESKPVETKPVNTKPVETTNTNTAKVASNNSASEAGMVFKIQLGAFSNEPSKGKFAGAGSVNIEMIDGLYKVTTGNYSNKEDAYKRIDELKAKGYNAFLVKYKNGKRVN